MKVGFVYLGPVGDFGWTYQHDQARQSAVRPFGHVLDEGRLDRVAEMLDG